MDWTLWQWPFFEPHHHELAARVAAWRSPVADHEVTEATLEDATRAIAASLAEAGFLDLVVPCDGDRTDLRAICIAREGIGYHSALADCTLAMQGIGAGGIVQAGTPAQRARLDAFRRGRDIAAFALTEPTSGSDVASLQTSATKVEGGWLLNGQKAYISNAPFADHYVVLARTGEAARARGLSAFSVARGSQGLHTGPATALIACHPAGPLNFENCFVPDTALIGTPGKGFHLAMAVFDTFRASVGAFTIGLARRAFDETVARVKSRHLFGAPMAELQNVQNQIAQMHMEIELGAMAVYRAAWAKDTSGGRCTREVSMAKLVATENGGKAIDRAVQIWGGMGVTQGCIIEQLYREARASRIYEGASEVQQLVIGRELLKGDAK